MPQPAVLARVEKRRLGSAAARALLCKLLAEVTGTAVCDWGVSPPRDGHPFIARHPASVRPPRVSLSHDGDTVACSASWTGLVGVDVQRDRPAHRLRAVAAFLGWPAYLVTSNDARLLTRAWAAWEACAKASGSSVLGPVPVFIDAMEALQGRPSSARCMAKRLEDGWLVVVNLPPHPGD
jgi:phosphopantetheinyl transferase